LMRWVLCTVAMLALTPSAFADDLLVLRGSQPVIHWGGFYGGAQVGFSSSTINFGQAPGSQVSFILRNTAIEQDEQISSWTVLGSRSPNSVAIGGFVGYNLEWEDVVTGFEVNYNHLAGLSAASSNSLTRDFTDSGNLPTGHHYFYNLTVAASSSYKITDVATFRARAGWEAGYFLPYTFLGLAVGRASFATATSVQYTAQDFPDSATPPLTPLPNLAFGPSVLTNSQNNTFAYGVAGGIGTEIALMNNIFVRGELEYIYFAPLAHIQASMTSARVGAGLKF
jgi:outer membrane immunogenic protein